ncbi:serine/threonine kinase family protein [Plesiocystis pacifica SIR-1]|uniref:Serine/threonine kinase family protein n=2 Tax=Plesiocystis pacifica TaxID=191768 RepID=A6G9L4_9BACT|nr:serine/threonine kinase family protein [Plesiocystis pacifica SIR-1]
MEETAIAAAPESLMETAAEPSLEATLDASEGGGEIGAARAPRAPRPGDRIGRYVLIERVGQGAMGTVYAAYDPDLDRRIALKLLRGRAAGDEQQLRLMREAQAMARVSHPNVVHVYEVGSHGRQVFLAMEFIEGQTLSAWLAAEKRSLAAILEVFVAAGRGLAAAHQAGLVHRDFKPDNVLVDRSGRPRVLDFGLARTEDAEIEAGRGSAVDGGASTAMSTELTRTGALLGTPAFMAAEQFAGRAATAQSDQFAFCVALWSALAGQRPFAGDTPMTLAVAVQEGRRRPMPANRDVPGVLREALERGLSRTMEERWPSMDALLEALEPAPASSRRWLGLALAGVAVLGVGLGLGLRESEVEADEADPCAGITGPMDAAWAEAERGAVQAAIAESGASSAEQVAARVDLRLDAYASRWRATATQACAATHRDQSQSTHMFALQQACLDRRLAAFGGLTQGLASAGPEAVERAVEAVEGLPRLERCADFEALLQAVAPPEDPAIAERVAEQRRRLARARSVAGLGRYAESEASLEACGREAEDLDYLPLQAEVAVALARVRVQSGRADEMARDARRGFALAVRAGDDATAALAATLLADALGTWNHRHEAAREWLTVAQAHLDGLPEPRTREQAELRSVEGNVEYVARELEASRASKLEAKALYEQLGSELEITQMLNDVAVVETALGDLGAARRALLEVRERQVAVLGEDHPEVGLVDQNLATVAQRAGDDDEAIRLFRRAMACAERSRGQAHPSYSVPKIAIAEIHLRQGKLEDATRGALAARALLEGTDSERYNHVRASLVVARAQLELGDEARALEAAGLAVDTAVEGLGEDHELTHAAWIVRGRALRVRGELDEAEADLRRALDGALGDEAHRNAGDAYAELAALLRERGRDPEAEAMAEASREWLARVGSGEAR